MSDTGLMGRIRLWRQTLGMTQADFAKATGIPISTLKGYESGSRKPGMDALAGIAGTGVNMNWLFAGKGEMHLSAAEGVDTSDEDSDRKLLTQVIIELLEVIDEDGYEVTDEDLTKLIVELYFYFRKGENVDTSAVKTFVRLVA